MRDPAICRHLCPGGRSLEKLSFADCLDGLLIRLIFTVFEELCMGSCGAPDDSQEQLFGLLARTFLLTIGIYSEFLPGGSL